LRALYRFLRSVKLAITLILIIAALSIVGTLIAQGRGQASYFHQYGGFWAQVILTLGLDGLFRSPLFLVPAGLLFINLSVCTVDRLVSRSRHQVRRRHGPDLIHIGLLLLLVGALLSVLTRKEGMAYLGQGDEIGLQGRTLRLLSLSFEKYGDGRPKEWTSTVEVRCGDAVVVPAFPIEVNRPLKIAGYKIYQTDYGQEGVAVLNDPAGESLRVSTGRAVPWGAAVLVFQSSEGSEAVFERWEKHDRTGVYAIRVGERIGEYTLTELTTREVTGLRAVKDPGFIPVVVALAVVAAGLTLTLLQKRKDIET
jgi:cytochrome c biogenesis protein ResB